MYLSPERRAISTSLMSLGLSKDPKDAQRQPSHFPDGCEMRLPHAQEIEVFVELDAERKTRCLRLGKSDLESDKDVVHSARGFTTLVMTIKLTYKCI